VKHERSFLYFCVFRGNFKKNKKIQEKYLTTLFFTIKLPQK